MSKETKPRPLSVDQLLARLQEDNGELLRHNNELKMQLTAIRQQVVVNAALGIYVREPDMDPADCLEMGLAFARACDKFLPTMEEVAQQFDQPADGAANEIKH